jgi:hypothetical protein
MTLIEAVSEAVTAKQAATLYGLKFDRRGKAVCPWHADHKPSHSRASAVNALPVTAAGMLLI